VNSAPNANEYRNVAELRSPVLGITDEPFDSQFTVEFWYYAGNGQTTLELRRSFYEGASWATELTKEHFVESSAEKLWRRAEATFCPLTERLIVKLSFLITPGTGFTFLGLDEVVTHRTNGA